MSGDADSGDNSRILARIAQLLECLVEQSSRRSELRSSQGSSQENPQKEFRCKQKRQDSQFRKQKSPKQPKTDQQKSLEQQPQPSNLAPMMNIKPTCPTCKKKHVGQCRSGQDGCYKCGVQGHIAKYCPNPKKPIDSIKCVVEADQETQLPQKFRYGPFNPYIPIRSTTIGKSSVAIDPIAMHTSWRSNSDIASVTSIGYPRMSANGESSTTMHRLLHSSGSHLIPTPYDPK
ncbi:hypothetical protein F511_03552 [Dorcoceras hygrometricum]|uniref:CCHC-type domain-containing protein n=1 Tax=Dorcoceras hygrometricum TaxID=472368 RepID=A0A2Z7BT47_9LAMI|nr:hypothetical protein F511_03552 [Dorcoceras hygrometricum]